MRKLLCFLLALLCAFLLCACDLGGNSDSTVTTVKPPKIAEKITIGYNTNGTPKIITDTDLNELLKYDEIHNLVLANYEGNDLSILKQVRGLHGLKLQSMENLTDLSFLTELKELKSLMIYDLSDEFTDISVLSKLVWLENLSVNNISVDDFSPLYSLTQLKSLDLTSTALTQAQYDALKAALPDCNIKNVTIYE